ncbi:MAG: response regulator [Azospira oryzae]|jgi:CheY-like chemotaxis protein|nr:MAG: response regulator [Azospira oryzae]
MSPSPRILLVEDDQDDQDFFITILNDSDEVPLYAIANNGKEAIEYLKASDQLPTLIFVDINMTLMNGMEFLQTLRNNQETMNIPVVMLSTSFLEKEQAKKLGANAYLKKSSHYENARDQINKMIRLDFIRDKLIASQTFTADR